MAAVCPDIDLSSGRAVADYASSGAGTHLLPAGDYYLRFGVP